MRSPFDLPTASVKYDCRSSERQGDKMRKAIFVVQLGFLAFSSIVILTSIYIAATASTPLPYFDSWIFASPESGSLSHLLTLHNEHRIAVTRLAFSVDKFLTNHSGLTQLVGIFIVLITGAGLFARAARLNRTAYIVTLFLISALFIHGVHFTNIAWQFQIGFVVAAIVPVFAFYILAGARSVHRAVVAIMLV